MPIRYCTATSKRTKKPCRARAMCGRNVCYHHGGKSRRGMDHPKFEHGYYSKDPVAQLMLSMHSRITNTPCIASSLPNY